MMRHHPNRLAVRAAGALIVSLLACSAAMAQPITTDSRIKTLVFSPNEVFALTTHYGYQSNIEFGPKETIETISVGDRVGWQISPAGRRLFIRAQEENAHTNMTVVTNLRAYQFDLRSSSSDAVFGSEELTYVVRFYYPEENPAPLPPPAPAPMVLSAPVAQAPVMQQPAPVVQQPVVSNAGFNYRYTFSGPTAAAPLKVFDDGKSTFFKFAGAAMPQISVISANGDILDVPVRRTSDGLVAVSVIAPRFSIKQGAQQVFVYNETNGGM